MMISMAPRNALVVAVFACCMFVFAMPRAHALAFAPTEAEWLAWPDYCRARYVESGAGQDSKFRNSVSPAVVAQQRARVGAEAWYWLHHYCAALSYMSRAAATQDELRAERLLRDAELNAMGQYQRMGKDNFLFPEVMVTIAQIHWQRGDANRAHSFLEEAMQAQPTAASPYAYAATLYRQSGEPAKAIAVLLRGDAAVNGQSAELHYFLGHAYIDVDELDAAVNHAKRAYDLGYPLPGLAVKLRRLGRTL